MKREKFWVGTSWKMNKLRNDAVQFAQDFLMALCSSAEHMRPFIIPPFPYIADVAKIFEDSKVMVGAQNMHWEPRGAWTGEVSAAMIKDCGASIVEIGHSERRTHFGETDETVALKTKAALGHGLIALVCVGDTKAEYDAGHTSEALAKQVNALLKYVGRKAEGQVVIAYEPVWSIGEGGTPASPEFANEQHDKISKLVVDLIGVKLPIIYGGSVNQQNCVALAKQPYIDGLFIGRAAWDVQGYIKIIEAVLGVLN